MDETIPVALIALLVHFTMATAFANIRWMRFWMLRTYGEVANLCYARYLEKLSDPLIPEKEIEWARKITHKQLNGGGGLFESFQMLTKPRNLYFGTWLPHLILCLIGEFIVRSVKKDIQKIRIDRLRREKLRA